MTRFQFVADHRDTFEVKRMCQVLQICRSGFYAWVTAAPARAARAVADEALAERVRAVHATSATHRAYGAPRVTAELNEAAGIADTTTGSTGSTGSTGRVNHKRVARVMATAGISGIRLRRRVVTTVPDLDTVTVPDLLKRDFTAPAPNEKYVGDITYLPCAGPGGSTSFLYLATVIDCASRRLVGWSIAEHMRTELVADALLAAAATRGSLAGAVFHSDHGAQYGAKSYAELCEQLGVRRSMGAVGTSADNALAESFNAALKRETLAGTAHWDSPQQARREVFAWLARYNTVRRHSACGQRPPAVYEAEHFTSTLPIAA